LFTCHESRKKIAFAKANTGSQAAWNKRDLILYAIGVGAKKDEFALVYGAFVSFI